MIWSASWSPLAEPPASPPLLYASSSWLLSVLPGLLGGWALHCQVFTQYMVVLMPLRTILLIASDARKGATPALSLPDSIGLAYVPHTTCGFSFH